MPSKRGLPGFRLRDTMANWRVLMVVLLVASAAACSSSSKQTTVRWTVVYPVGNIARDRTDAPRCPTGATCQVVRNRSVTYSNGSHAWTTLATRTLNCPNGPGDYPAPARACQALDRLRAILRIKPQTACRCPATLWPVGKATATMDGKRVTVPLDFCPYCGRSTRATTGELLYLQLQPPS
jgi:hypothetical protein